MSRAVSKTDGTPSRVIGANHFAAKLDADKVREIRRLSSAGITGKAIAAKVGVTPGPVCSVLKGYTWRHVA